MKAIIISFTVGFTATLIIVSSATAARSSSRGNVGSGSDSSGNVRLTNNVNVKTKFTGASNRGSVLDNVNLKLTCTECSLNIVGNANGKISGENSTLTVLDCSNINVSGKGNVVTLKGDANGNFNGDGMDIDAVDNANAKVTARGGRLKLRGNANLNVDTEEGNVVATDNSNLRVVGPSPNVKVKDTANHELRNVGSRDGEPVNQVEISPSSGSSSFSSVGGTVNYGNILIIGSTIQVGGGDGINQTNINMGMNNNVKFVVDYVGEVVIEGGSYRVGRFDFNLKKVKGGLYEVKFPKDSVEVKSASTGEVVLRRTGGITEYLKLRAPQVRQRDGAGAGEGITFDVDMTRPDEPEMARN